MEQKPLTPPHVSGVSLAPMLDPDGGGGAAGVAPGPPSCGRPMAPAERPTRVHARPSQPHLAAAAKAAAVAAAGPDGTAGAAAAAAAKPDASAAAPQLMAEGRGIQRAAVAVDPRIAYYHEINGDGDSAWWVCGREGGGEKGRGWEVGSAQLGACVCVCEHRFHAGMGELGGGDAFGDCRHTRRCTRD